MDVKKENQIPAEKFSVWVLAYSDDGYGQQGDFIRAVFMDKPTIIDLARWFQENGDKNRHACAMSALVFLDHLVNGGGRKGAEGSWYTLKEITAR